ncbi:TPA: succinate--CoA ligase subunit alpha [bacterium]|nr:MAG: succinate--CoA ligase subunit alpha [Candidatus Hydrogenedentes bacterium CG1_02_42_14]PIU46203.1 MAG: succinate--CoA ligase subunit alpha [Candidatus Hydrogenedentes bacterium CG07_land_8_20_14_0_80_42_17]HBW46574.1 succinate--CoA ligase subunit alpha [bacterium]
MSILVNSETRLLVQGITGSEGTYHSKRMLEYGTKIVAGVTPNKGGTNYLGIPVYNTVSEAVTETSANVSIIYVPAPFAADAILESAYAGIPLVVCITEGIPALEMMRVHASMPEGVRLIGPNCPGVITPSTKTKVGIMPGHIHLPGRVGVISRSGTLTYEIVKALTDAKLGQSTAIGIGGDPLPGTNFIDCLELFRNDDETDAVAIIGEIGGSDEEKAAEYVAKGYSKPVIGFIAGQSAPPGKRMGHAGAIISGGKGTAEEKKNAFRAAGIKVADLPSEVVPLLKESLR